MWAKHEWPQMLFPMRQSIISINNFAELFAGLKITVYLTQCNIDFAIYLTTRPAPQIILNQEWACTYVCHIHHQNIGLLQELCYCNLTAIGTSQGRWRFRSISHSFWTLDSGTTLRRVRAECGLWEDDRNAEVTTLIYDASLHSIVHCAPSWQPHCEDPVKIKDYFPTCKSQVQSCPCVLVFPEDFSLQRFHPS